MAGEVRLLLFATAREAVGRPILRLPIPREGRTIRALLTEVRRAHPELASVLPTCRVARNGRYVRGLGGRVRAGDEIALHPPYSGG